MEEEPKIVEVVSEDEEEPKGSDEEYEEMNLPEFDEKALDPENMSWPPRPTISHMADLYDEMKAFIIDDTRMELIYPPMTGEERKIVHTIAELFGLQSKSYGGKKNRHVRVYKYEDVPTSLEGITADTVAAGNSNVRMKEIKIPMFIKESQDAVREEVIATTKEGKELLKRVIKEGAGESPVHGHQVYLHYEGYYEDGGVFDSTRLREKEFMFVVGEGHVISGWDIAVATMKPGELVELIVPPEYAFGPLGCPPRIPANTTLKYEIELIRFSLPLSQDAKSNKLSLSLDQSIDCSVSSRCEGNNLVNSNSFRKATKCYNRGLNYFLKFKDLTEEEDVRVNEAKLPLHSNLAFCYLKLKDYNRAKKAAEDALQIDANHKKALCRLGEALVRLNQIEEAEQVLKKAYSLDNTEPRVRKLLREIQDIKQQERERQKRMFQGVFT